MRRRLRCKQNVSTAHPKGQGCAICREGFSRVATTCRDCPSDCTKCTSTGRSLSNDDLWLKATSFKCASFDTLTNCTEKTHDECALCDEGVFVSSQRCVPCQSTTDSCATCNVVGVCTGCDAGHVLVQGSCVATHLIAHCLASEPSKRTVCSFWHRRDVMGHPAPPTRCGG